MTAERDDFGARLRAAREARGITLRQIAAATKISMLALEALERQDLSRLPGGLFSRAFVRAYAKEVGLDPEKTVREFTERFAEEQDPVLSEAAMRDRAARREPDVTPSRGGLRWFWLGITLALIVAFFAVQQYFVQQSGTGPAVAPKPATSQRPPEPPPPPAPSPAVNEAATVAAVEAPPPGADAAPSVPGQNPTVAPAAGQAAPPDQAQPAVDPANAALRLVLSVDSECWISAKADAKQITRETLKAGQRLEISAAKTIYLYVGNPAAVVYTLNGMPGRPLGLPNQATEVTITTSNMQTFTR